MTELASIVRRADYFRRSPARIGGRGDHKEWLHFCVHQGELDVLVNFGVNDERNPSKGAPVERGQLILLVRDGDRWAGDAERYWESTMEIGGGEVYARMGASTLALAADGSFSIRAALPAQSIEVELRLRPETFPSLANNIRLSGEHQLSWLVVPRLTADGIVRVGQQTWPLHGAMAYHDHNWGHFLWGADFAWEWGYGLPVDPSSPWSFMFVRLSDKAMACTKTQVLSIWRGAKLVRSFRGRQLRITAGDAFAPAEVFRVPPVMALLSPGRATEVPASLVLEAEADGDVFRVELRPRSVAQIVVPNDRDAGVTRINEVAAEFHAFGRILDEAVDYEGGGVFEVLAS